MQNLDFKNPRFSKVVMYYTPGHLCPGCVVHHYSQFYGKIFLEQSDCTNEFKKVIVQANLTKVIVQAIAQSK